MGTGKIGRSTKNPSVRFEFFKKLKKIKNLKPKKLGDKPKN
jgi:hypothetical protein